MPYKNVHYIKLMLELLDDKRFIKDCNDSQKLDYILWLAMAGLTQNESEEDAEWFKKRFNLSKPVDEIRSNLCFLLATFRKMYRQKRNGKYYVKFKKFKELHNPIRNAEGMPKDSPKTGSHLSSLKVKAPFPAALFTSWVEYAPPMAMADRLNEDTMRIIKIIKIDFFIKVLPYLFSS